MDKNKTSVAAIIGLVFAILALLLSAVPIVNNFAFVLAIIGLICGVVALVGISKGKKSGKNLSIATIIISILAFAIVLITQQIYTDALDDVSKDLNEASKDLNDTIDRSSGEKTDDILGKDVDVELGKFSTKTDEYGIVTTQMTVDVSNKLDDKKSYSIQVEAVNKDGKRIVDDNIYANDLGAKQSQEFKIFQFVEESKLAAVKKADFKIVSVSQN